MGRWPMLQDDCLFHCENVLNRIFVLQKKSIYKKKLWEVKWEGGLCYKMMFVD